MSCLTEALGLIMVVVVGLFFFAVFVSEPIEEYLEKKRHKDG